MRKVIVTPAKGYGEPYVAKFHQWSAEYEEFETGPGNYSVAIVELEDGSVRTPPAHWIKFEEPQQVA